MATKKTVIPAKQQAKSTAVSARKSSELTAYDANIAAELENDSGRGFEEANRDAFAIPFLVILQDLSPQVKSKMVGYIPGAKPGQIFQNVSQALKDTTRIIPCHYSQVFIEWVPRAKGGGFVALYDPVAGAAKIATAIREEGELVLPNGNTIMDTRQHFCLELHEDGSTEPCLLALKSSGLKI